MLVAEMNRQSDENARAHAQTRRTAQQKKRVGVRARRGKEGGERERRGDEHDTTTEDEEEKDQKGIHKGVSAVPTAPRGASARLVIHSLAF